MTARDLAPVIPPSSLSAARQHGRSVAGRPLLLARPELLPSVPDDVVYGIGRLDVSGRIADRAVTSALGWRGGDRLTLTTATRQRLPIPTFADYVPVVSAAVTDGTRRAYGTYWNRITEQWGTRRLDEPTPSEVRQLMRLVKANAVQRRNGRGGRSAQEHLVAALRCLLVSPRITTG